MSYNSGKINRNNGGTIFMTKNEKLKAIGLRYRKEDINDDYFEKIDNHNKAYVLGAMYSDGYLVIEGTKTKRIGIDSIDREWLENIAKDMQYTGEIVELKKNNDNKEYVISKVSKNGKLLEFVADDLKFRKNF